MRGVTLEGKFRLKLKCTQSTTAQRCYPETEKNISEDL